MNRSPISELEKFGQSIWLDYIRRDLFLNDNLKMLIDEYNLRGMTSNPSIFEKAIAESHEYDQAIKKMTLEGKEVNQIYEALTQQDVQDAADTFRDLYDKTNGKDGYVSLEVNPHLAYDANGTIELARYLWKALDRPNVLIKVPGTKEGLIAIKQLISEGINVNVTLLFGISRYLEVVEAYMSGLEARVAQGKSIKQIASVASFFLSRIDVLLDPVLEKHIAANSENGEIAKPIHGQIAIASAKIAYDLFTELFNSDRFQKLVTKGAHVQRLLWASTSTKNPNYSDVKYVEALIGPETVNTLPLETIEHYRDHGDPTPRLVEDLETARKYFRQLPELGINLDKSTQDLEDEGVEKFTKSYDQLIATLKKGMLKNAQK